MHPKTIISDFKSLGASFSVEGDELYINNPANIYPELEELAKGNKSRIVTYLKGEYSDKEHNVKQTIDKIVDFYREGCRIDSKINDWLQNDVEGLNLVMDLVVEFSRNGWTLVDPVCNFENKITDEMSKEIYERAMTYFKKGAAAG
ncbi:hypothetical protein AABM38_20590 [Heyndrickxia sp. MSNUG]|uniref:hypothetical protein n=1 Tax=Heyndrickxia sp. MSNUG TaxID=3136677 RepID=UPI003C2D5BAF